MVEPRPQITIGSKLYRRYTPDLWNHTREKTRQKAIWVVVGETRRSWLAKKESLPSWADPIKIPKKKLPNGWTADASEWDDWCFAAEHRYRISEAVNRYATPRQLRAIAEMIGWSPEEEK